MAVTSEWRWHMCSRHCPPVRSSSLLTRYLLLEPYCIHLELFLLNSNIVLKSFYSVVPINFYLLLELVYVKDP